MQVIKHFDPDSLEPSMSWEVAGPVDPTHSTPPAQDGSLPPAAPSPRPNPPLWDGQLDARTLPHSTPITFRIGNPKSGASAVRYAKYRHATTIAQMLELGAKRADIKWDFDHGFFKVLSPAALQLFAPPTRDVLSLNTTLLARSVRSGCKDADCAAVASPVASQVMAELSSDTSQLSRTLNFPEYISLSELTDLASQRIAHTMELLDDLPAEPDPASDFAGEYFLHQFAPGHLPVPVASIATSDVPMTIKAASRTDEWDGSGNAIYDELVSLVDVHKVLRIVHQPEVDAIKAAKSPRQKVQFLHSRVIYDRKFNSSMEEIRKRGRLVGCQNRDKYEVDDCFSPTTTADSVLLMFDVAARFACKLIVYDVSKAYLQGKRSVDTDDLIFIFMPSGIDKIAARFKDARFSPANDAGDRAYFFVTGNLYGLREAGKIWYLHNRDWHLSIGFQQASTDPALVYYRDPVTGDFIFVAIHVDDFLICPSTLEIQAWYTQRFIDKYGQPSVPLDGVEEYLSIAFRSTPDHRQYFINTPKSWRTLREKCADNGIDVSFHASAPMRPEAVREIAEQPSDDNPLIAKSEVDVRSLLGVAAWIVRMCRPAELFPLSFFAAHAHTPTKLFVKHFSYFLAYLLERDREELTFNGHTCADNFSSFVDASLGNDPRTMRSWYGYVFIWAGAIHCRSKKCPVVTLASRDAEAVAAVMALKSILAYRIMMAELGFGDLAPFRLRIDNQSTIGNTQADKIHKDSRHMGLRLSLLREEVKRNHILPQYIPTEQNLADIFTKPLSPSLHEKFRRVIMGHAPISSVVTDTTHVNLPGGSVHNGPAAEC